MRLSDALLALAVSALGLFVGVEVVRRPPVAAPAPAGASVAPASAPIAASAARDVRVLVTHSSNAAAEKSAVVRWPDRPEKGLRIWVQSMSPVPDWDLRYAQMARDAFADWSGDGLPMRLDFVLDSATADVTILWTERFAAELGSRVGVTTRTNDQNGWLVAAQIVVAVHDSAGRRIEPANLTGIVRHEAGHALGLGHSQDPHDKMYPVEMANDISSADRATLRQLYQPVPAPVR